MSDVDNKVKMVVEGLLLAAGRPLSLDNIAQVFSKHERPDRKELKAVMQAISVECDDRGFELKEVASGFRFQVKQELSEWVAKLWEERPPRYTRALLETLSLIVYRQPITRGDIEEIRGVGVSPNIIRTLLDREWVRVVGHRDVPGRPAMFATTRQFLDYFNLKNLQDLPPLSEIKDLGKPEQELDLEDDLANRRILELPEEVVDDSSYELSTAEEAEMLAEEEAVELSKKPLDEILKMGLPEELQALDDELDEEQQQEQDTEETAEQNQLAQPENHEHSDGPEPSSDGDLEADHDSEAPDVDDDALLANEGRDTDSSSMEFVVDDEEDFDS
ncbi:MAG: SMC-Scp complex subunit ScpB [Gammaproteobacteria bacterium]|jgi:segregation and condensation protein B|nr:SMC-Scp complex subunit ScpB [Gammaproteobacteria bacterium]